MTLAGNGRSIHATLLLGAIALLVVVLGCAAVLAYHVAEHEAEEVFDARLATSARVLDVLTAPGLETSGARQPMVITLPSLTGLGPGHEANSIGHFYETKIAFQVFNAAAELLLRSESAPIAPFAPLAAGFSTQRFEDGEWRVFAMKSAGSWIQVAERIDIREELCTTFALISVTPFVAGIPLLLLLLSLLIRYGLAPLSELARRIERREPASLEPVTLRRSPAEIAPVVTALNGLFKRVHDALARERRFTAAAAHELRTPLAALKLHAENAWRAASESERKTSLDRMAAAMRKTQRLAVQMLAFSRASAPTDPALRSVSLRTVVEDAIEESQPQMAARGTRLAMTCEPDDAAFEVRGDRDKLSSLVGNLLENAIRYGPQKGLVRVALAVTARGVTLAIEDEGPGIEPGLRERVFESYFRAPGNVEEGTGLGLAIVKEIAIQHGASIDVDDAPGGRGARITVRFSPVDAGAPGRRDREEMVVASDSWETS